MRLASSSVNGCHRLRAIAAPVDRREGRRGFSLVEILSVLAVISIMALVGLPSITAMSQSGSLTAGGNDLADLAVMAHDYAVSHNVMTALVGVTSATTVPSAAQYRAFIVLASDPTGQNWAPVSKWVFLPSAVTMSSYASLNTFQTFKGAYPPQNLSLNLEGANVTSGYAYQTFYPDGHMDTTASSVVLHIVTNQNKTTKTDPKDYYDLVFNPMTGTVKINRP